MSCYFEQTSMTFWVLRTFNFQKRLAKPMNSALNWSEFDVGRTALSTLFKTYSSLSIRQKDQSLIRFCAACTKQIFSFWYTWISAWTNWWAMVCSIDNRPYAAFTWSVVSHETSIKPNGPDVSSKHSSNPVSLSKITPSAL